MRLIGPVPFRKPIVLAAMLIRLRSFAKVRQYQLLYSREFCSFDVLDVEFIKSISHLVAQVSYGSKVV